MGLSSVPREFKVWKTPQIISTFSASSKFKFYNTDLAMPIEVVVIVN